MKIVINYTSYTAIDSLGFSPETDLTNTSMPINEFEARIFTNDQIAFGQWAELRDDNNNLWARYWLRYAERIGRDDDRQTYIVKIIGQSPIAFLERVTMAAEFINNDAYSEISYLLDFVGNMGQESEIIDDNVIAQEFENIQIVGFAPEQTARERLEWLLLAAGGYVRSYFDTTIHIHKIPTSVTARIPLEKVFWKPSIAYRDYVTKIKVTAYTYTAGTPDTTDEYVTDGTDFWIQTKSVITVNNSYAPSGAPKNEVVIDGVTLINPTLASTVIMNLAAYYFNRVEIDGDVINNGEYTPGDLIMMPVSEDQYYSGYLDRTDYRFGLQARSSVHLTASQAIQSATLTIVYQWNSTNVAQQRYLLPKGYEYEINTEYLDLAIGGHRYIFRPTVASVTGTLTGDTTRTVTVEVALDGYSERSNSRNTIIGLYDSMRNLILEIYNTELMLIQREYSGQKYIRELHKYLKQISELQNSDMESLNTAQQKSLESISDTNYILHILSVDEVDYEDDVVYDPDDRTVVIS